MSLAARRFPQTITRRRQMPGYRNDHGEFIEGSIEETEFRASVQPMSLEDNESIGGGAISHRLRTFVPEPDALAAAFDDAEADTVVYGSLEFTVEESQSWPGSHTRAVLLRQS
ncbi:MAG: hypothetical protein OXF33_02160 [Rhodospirillales bacterium]|nr:hypothetical protein [Rhodospirillales bacterium]